MEQGSEGAAEHEVDIAQQPQQTHTRGDDPYLERLERAHSSLLLAADESDQHLNQGKGSWKRVLDKKGVTVDVKYEEGVPIASARAKSIIKAPVADVYKFTQSIEFLNDIDPLYMHGRVVETLDENHDILYSAYSCGVFILANRDFIYYEGRKHNEDGSKIVTCFSIERDDVPPVKGFVRGHIHYSGWVLRPINDGKETQATFSAQADPKGWIPHKLVNFFSGEIAKTMWNIQSFLEKGHAKSKNTKKTTEGPKHDS
eukprot:TRINITY_DN7565_c0_g1_i2.p1 TRINITY_DN7565_c0_g1~~TRINITY_DN7565_c0_g1_i2.p1  ORF type:complete len:269 (-),score=67.01 TRINITY_DN7565_c0_g1_i2:105-875(-)